MYLLILIPVLCISIILDNRFLLKNISKLVKSSTNKLFNFNRNFSMKDEENISSIISSICPVAYSFSNIVTLSHKVIMNPYTIYDKNCIEQIIKERTELNKMHKKLVSIKPTLKVRHAYKHILKGIENGIYCADIIIEGTKVLDMTNLMTAGKHVLLGHNLLSLGIDELNKLKCDSSRAFTFS